MKHLLSPKSTLKVISLWPPFLFTGVSVQKYNEEFTSVQVGLKTSLWNQNYFGTHFGGTLYSMCDPFYAIILLHHIGREHIVWDKSAHINFIKAIKTPVSVEFHIPLTTIESLKSQALQQFNLTPTFRTNIVDSHGQTIAKVKRTLYVRRKDAKDRFNQYKNPGEPLSSTLN